MWGEKAKSKEARIFPELPDDEAGARERVQFKKGLIFLDIVFDSSGHPYILEIQGMDAGLKGLSDDLASDPRVSSDALRFAQSHRDGETGHQNPRWFEEVGKCKAKMLDFIPDAYRPKSVVNNDFKHLFEGGKTVVVKPLDGTKGKDILVFSNARIEDALKYASMLQKSGRGFIAQELIVSSGAENAPPEKRGYAASLRLAVPFEIVDGKARITQPDIGYQRVGQTDPAQQNERALVVNKARGALSVPMSANEYKRALPAVYAVLHELTTQCERSQAYQRDLAENLMRKNSEILQSIWNKEGIQCDHYLLASINYFNPTLEESRQINRWLRFVQRELQQVSKDTAEKLRKNGCIISIYYRSENKGYVEFYKWDKTMKRDFSSDSPPGVIVNDIEFIAEKKKLPKPDKGSQQCTESPLIIPTEYAFA